MHKAASDDNRELVKLLIERGAEVNKRTRAGLTPLNYAVKFQLREMLQLLIDRGAGPRKWSGPKRSVKKGGDV